jgi:hypothetical protein
MYTPTQPTPPWQAEVINHRGENVYVLGSDLLADQIVPDYIGSGVPLSIVRMSDGEEKILSWCKSHVPNGPMNQFTDTWRKKYGVDGITNGEMRRRLEDAAAECTYFAPDGGEWFFEKHFTKRMPFAEIYFPHRWSRGQRQYILAKAKHVLVINARMGLHKDLQSSRYNVTGCRFSHITLNHWTQSETVIDLACKHDAPLVFASCGPASKYIIPRIAQSGKVVLDMGSGAPHFWCIRGSAECPEGKCGAVAKP